MKQNAGFSYVEVIVATALFVILLASALSLITAAARNAERAESLYETHLAANSLMQVTRDNITSPDLASNISSRALDMDIQNYTIWVIKDNQIFTFGDIFYDMPNVSGSFSGDLIIAVIRDDDGEMIGRAVGAI